MSTHCLSCGSKSPEGESEEDENKNTWVILRAYNDPDYRKPGKHPRPIEEWWIHRVCLRKLLAEEVCVETKV